MKLINRPGWETHWQNPPLNIGDQHPVEVGDELGKKILAQEKTVMVYKEIKDTKEIKHGK